MHRNMHRNAVRRVIARTLNLTLERFSNPTHWAPHSSAQEAVSGTAAAAAQEGIPVLTCAGDRGACSICLEEIVEGDTFRLLPCSDTVNHSFHKICIDAWLTLHATCPTCRANVST